MTNQHQMNSEEMDSFLTRNKEVFYNEDGTAKFKNNEDLAGLIAEKSGYKTFATDYAMLLMDIPQFAGINSLWRGLATKKATNALRIAMPIFAKSNLTSFPSLFITLYIVIILLCLSLVTLIIIH